MNEDQKNLLLNAREALQVAEIVMANGFSNHAVSQAYFCMFYVAEACLEEIGLRFSKHSAVISEFGRHFAREGVVPAEFHRFLIDAFDDRHLSDYGRRQALTLKGASEHIKRARRMLEFVQNHLTNPDNKLDSKRSLEQE